MLPLPDIPNDTGRQDPQPVHGADSALGDAVSVELHQLEQVDQHLPHQDLVLTELWTELGESDRMI